MNKEKFLDQLFIGNGNYKNRDVLEILNEFEWNWFLAADHLNCDPDQLKEIFTPFFTSDIDITEEIQNASFESSHIHPEDIQKLKDFVNANLKDSMPLLFNNKLSAELKSNIAQKVLIEMGLTWKLTHSPEFLDIYKSLEDEALQLQKWREQIQYLTLIEESLFKISYEQKLKAECSNLSDEDESNDS